MLCVTGYAIQPEVTGLPIPGQNLWQVLLGIDHRQLNTPIDAITQAQLSMHNREIKTCGTTGTLQTLRLKAL